MKLDTFKFLSWLGIAHTQLHFFLRKNENQFIAPNFCFCVISDNKFDVWETFALLKGIATYIDLENTISQCGIISYNISVKLLKTF